MWCFAKNSSIPIRPLRVAKLIEAITSVMDNESTALGVLTSLNTTLFGEKYLGKSANLIQYSL